MANQVNSQGANTRQVPGWRDGDFATVLIGLPREPP